MAEPTDPNPAPKHPARTNPEKKTLSLKHPGAVNPAPARKPPLRGATKKPAPKTAHKPARPGAPAASGKIGRASCRERVWIPV